MEDVMIRPATIKDMLEIAYIHKNVFSDHFIGMLPKYLISRFYQCYLKEENIFLVKTDEAHTISGFILGGYSSMLDKCKGNFIKENIFSLVFSIIVTPKIYPLFFKRLKKHNEFKSSIPFSLLSIGVQEAFKGKGIAQQLILQFEKTLRAQNIYYYGLSVYRNNGRAINFYKKCNFWEEGESDRLFHFYKEIEK